MTTNQAVLTSSERTLVDVEVKIPMDEANISSDYYGTDPLEAEASKALDYDESEHFHTGCSGSEWWSASFVGSSFKVSRVRIQNRSVGGTAAEYDRLAKAEIWIDEQLCGTLPDTTSTAGEWYETTCPGPGLIGETITVKGEADCLHFTQIEAYGYV